MGWTPFLPCLNLSSIISSSPPSLQASIRFRPPPETRHPLTSDSIMGGCASKPKELDAPAASPLSSDNPQPETTAQSNANGGESQIEKSEPEAEKEAAQASSSEDVSVKTDGPKEEEVKATDENDEDKAEDATKEPVMEAEAAEQKPNDALPSKEEVKSEAPLAAL